MPGALMLLTSVWLTLLVGQLSLAPRLGPEGALLVSFAVATGLVLCTRRPSTLHACRASLGALLLGIVVGLMSYPAWIALVLAAGAVAGLEAPGPQTSRAGAGLAVATLCFAPLFEELLYRERLLRALQQRYGAVAAVLATSAAFAASHLEPWALLGTFLVGLALGVVACLSGNIALCIGLHAGLNLAAWLTR